MHDLIANFVPTVLLMLLPVWNPVFAVAVGAWGGCSGGARLASAAIAGATAVSVRRIFLGAVPRHAGT